MQVLKSILTAFLCITQIAPASAWRHGRAPSGAPTGLVQVGGFDINGIPFSFINLFKSAFQQDATGGYAYPGVLDNNGYPASTPTTAITALVDIPPSTAYSGAYVLKNANVSRANVPGSPSGTFRTTLVAQEGGTFTVSSDYNGSASGSGTGTLTVSGTDPRVVFSLSGTTGTARIRLVVTFPTTGTWSGTPDLVLCRDDQEATLDSGQIFTADAANPTLGFINQLTTLNPVMLRPMDWSFINSTLMSEYECRAPVKAFSYRVTRWCPSRWVGNISNGGSGSAFTASLPSGWAALADGVMVQGQALQAPSAKIAVSAVANNGSGLMQLTVADTTGLSNGQQVSFCVGSGGNCASGNGDKGANAWVIANVVSGTPGTIDLVGSQYQTTLAGYISTDTLNVGETGAKIVLGNATGPSWTANALVIASYDALVDAWRIQPSTSSGASSGAVPLDVQIALANKLNKNLWINLPLLYNNTSMQSAINLARDSLNPNLTAFFELSNEVWNPGFTQWLFAFQKGQKLGFPVSRGDGLGNPQNLAYFGLRQRMMYGYIESSYAAVGRTNYQRVNAVQLFGDSGAVQKGQFNGYDLAPSGTSTGSGNALYTAFTGGADYTTFPHRPLDHSDGIAVAPYVNGAQVASPRNGNGWNSDVTTGGPTGWTTGLKGAADSYALQTAQGIQDAFDFISWDITEGTRAVNPPGPSLTLNSTAVKYGVWNTIAASYDAQRSGGGLATLKLDMYEGAPSIAMVPVTADCTAMGLNATTYCGSAAMPNSLIYNMLLAYKHSDHFKLLTKKYYDDFRAFSHARYPSFFYVYGTSSTSDNSIWSLFEGSAYTPAPYKSWDATIEYNTNWLLKRDLDPASNDNDPMWLEKSA